ncbi:MAG: DNA replication/repair protein RecF [Prolixibacteraceae bacterium]|nr:DNA replication/repair protein RecF [Prolixibacteraceae bacterium]
MYLKSLSLLNYKNIEQADLDFCPKLNCFLGDNGAGKTNILDSIYYLSFCKSFFNTIDSFNIKHQSDFFMLKGQFSRMEDNELISCGFKAGNKKQFKRNHKLYKRLSDHIGLFPLVMISPSDSSLISGGSDERRKFIDGVVSQFDHQYLETLIRYNRTLAQRNDLLKKFAENRAFDADMLSVYDEQLIEHGEEIHQKRKEFLSGIIPVFQHFYEFISGGKEKVVLEYNSSLNDGTFRKQLSDYIQKDRMSQYTNAGIHKDDLALLIGDYPIKKLGSQGQNKTYLTALKFAQFEYLKNAAGIKPILLLDDIFDKLDSKRVEKIIELVSDDQFGQIFITDTNREHLEKIVGSIPSEHKIFRITDGKIEYK